MPTPNGRSERLAQILRSRKSTDNAAGTSNIQPRFADVTGVSIMLDPLTGPGERLPMDFANLLQQYREDHTFGSPARPIDVEQTLGAYDRLPPSVVNASQYQRTREMTLEELLLENRVIFLVGEIHPGSAARVIMQMLYLENQKKGQDINFYINSPGGVVDDTLAIYDTMRFISSEVSTVCIGRAYSGGAVLLCAGEKGKRLILPHAKVMIHQPHGGVTGQASDIQIQADQIIKDKRTLTQIIADHTGQSFDRVSEDKERDKFFSAHEAKEYGLVDEVFEFGKEEEKK